MTPEDVAIAKVLAAWRNPGPFPKIHYVAKMKLLRFWPTLYKALEELDRATYR